MVLEDGTVEFLCVVFVVFSGLLGYVTLLPVFVAKLSLDGRVKLLV